MFIRAVTALDLILWQAIISFAFPISLICSELPSFAIAGAVGGVCIWNLAVVAISIFAANVEITMQAKVTVEEMICRWNNRAPARTKMWRTNKL